MFDLFQQLQIPGIARAGSESNDSCGFAESNVFLPDYNGMFLSCRSFRAGNFKQEKSTMRRDAYAQGHGIGKLPTARTRASQRSICSEHKQKKERVTWINPIPDRVTDHKPAQCLSNFTAKFSIC